MEDENLDVTMENQGSEMENTSFDDQGMTDNIDNSSNEQNNLNNEFSIDDLNFDDTYNVGGYDFSKYRDIIPENSLNNIENYVKEFEDRGFTQEQVEFLIDKEIENDTFSKLDPETVKADLSKNLTLEEKRNYHSVGQTLKQALDSDGLGDYFEEAMSNPIVFKLINSVIKNSRGQSVGIPRTERETRTNRRMTADQAIETLNSFIKSNMGIGSEKINAKQKELAKNLSEKDRAHFMEIVGM